MRTFTEQKESGVYRAWKRGCPSTCVFFSIAVQQEKEMVELKEQLQSVIGDLTHIKSAMSSISEGGGKAIPRELSVGLWITHSSVLRV